MELMCNAKDTFLTKIESIENVEKVLISPGMNKKILRLKN